MADHMIGHYRQKGLKWVEQAEKAQRRFYMDSITVFKFQDASYYQENAAKCFIIAKRFQDAGVSYKFCGRMEEKLGKVEVAASFYHAAAECFQKYDPQESANCYGQAVNLYCQVRRFSTAARLEIEIAELMESDRNLLESIAHYTWAAQFYRAQTCYDKMADQCLLKVASNLGLCGRFIEAAGLYEEVGYRCLDDNLLKFNAPDLFLRSVICLICACGKPEAQISLRRSQAPSIDTPTPEDIQERIDLFAKASLPFRASRQLLFSIDLATAANDGDIDLFADRVYAYDNACKMDSWFLTMLKVINDQVQAKSALLARGRAKQKKIRDRKMAELSASRGQKMGSKTDPSSIVEDDNDDEEDDDDNHDADNEGDTGESAEDNSERSEDEGSDSSEGGSGQPDSDSNSLRSGSRRNSGSVSGSLSNASTNSSNSSNSGSSYFNSDSRSGSDAGSGGSESGSETGWSSQDSDQDGEENTEGGPGTRGDRTPTTATATRSNSKSGTDSTSGSVEETTTGEALFDPKAMNGEKKERRKKKKKEESGHQSAHQIGSERGSRSWSSTRPGERSASGETLGSDSAGSGSDTGSRASGTCGKKSSKSVSKEKGSFHTRKTEGGVGTKNKGGFRFWQSWG